jgi:hypothetical protein
MVPAQQRSEQGRRKNKRKRTEGMTSENTGGVGAHTEEGRMSDTAVTRSSDKALRAGSVRGGGNGEESQRLRVRAASRDLIDEFVKHIASLGSV